VSLEMTVKIQWQKEQISLLKQRIKRLEEAGDKLTPGAAAALMWPEIEAWRKAKEAKP
jgi:hypothetical protein